MSELQWRMHKKSCQNLEYYSELEGSMGLFLRVSLFPGGCLMIHLSGPSQELKERFHFYPTTTQWAQFTPEPAPLEEEGVYLVTGGEKPNDNNTQWDSSSSFDTLNEDLSENQTWLGNQEESNPTDNEGLELVSLLMSCAESISYGNHIAVSYFLCRLGELASPRGPTIHRVAAYFTEALAIRASKLWPHLFAISPLREFADLIDDNENSVAIRLLDQVSPIPKFLHFSSNERILSAFEGKDRVHIIDFDIKEGLQWPSLLQSLASRPNPPTHVRMTAVGDSREEVHDTGVRLKRIAESLNLPFDFHPVVDRLEDVRLWMLHVKENECVAVNCVLQLHKLLHDDSALIGLLGLIRSTNPLILIVAEEEAEHNDNRWEVRFAKALSYYSVVFDSLQSSFLPEDSSSRIVIEEMFARRIKNIVGCEGRERVERHEKFDRWQQMLEGGGFRCLAFDEKEAIRSRMLLRMYSSGDDYSVEKRGDRLTLKFLDQALYTVSAWTPISSEDSSSTAPLG